MSTTISLPSWLEPIDVEGYVRLGSDHDGGYVLPLRLVRDADALLSMGVGWNWRFERDVHARKPMMIQAYDHTVSERQFRRAWGANLVMCGMGKARWGQVRRSWARWRDYRAFFGGPATHFRQEVTPSLVSTMFERIGPGKLLVKIDIDGAEYDVLADVLGYADRILGIVLEVHDLTNREQHFESLMQTILQRYAVVHVHVNNFDQPKNGRVDTLELTLMRQDLVPRQAGRLSLPHPLDQPNDPSRPDIRVKFDAQTVLG